MKTNVYEMVTNRIIEQLEKGMIPWQKLGADLIKVLTIE